MSCGKNEPLTKPIHPNPAKSDQAQHNPVQPTEWDESSPCATVITQSSI